MGFGGGRGIKEGAGRRAAGPAAAVRWERNRRAAGPAAQPPPRRFAPGGPARRAGRPAARCRHPAGGCRGSGGRRAEGGLCGAGRVAEAGGKAPCRNRAARRATRPEGGFGGGRRPPPTAAKPPALRACVLPIWQGAVSGGAFVLEPAQKCAKEPATLCILAADMIR